MARIALKGQYDLVSIMVLPEVLSKRKICCGKVNLVFVD